MGNGTRVLNSLQSELQRAGGDLQCCLVGGGKRRGRGKKRSPRAGPAKPASIKDWGSIKVATNQRMIRLPRPFPITFRVRQVANTFNASTGLSNLGGTTAANLVLGSSTLVAFQVAFELQDLAQQATWTAAFDQYQIEKVLLRFKSRNNAVSLFNLASPNAAMPTGYMVIDRDDATVLASVAAAEEYDTVETFEGNQDVVCTIKPSVTPSIFASGAFSAYTVEESDAVWIDVANNNVPHYGIKGVISGLTLSTTSSWVWDVSAEYIVAFKNVR